MGSGNALGYVAAAYNIYSGMTKGKEADRAAAQAEASKPVKKTSQYDRDALNLTGSDLANGMSAETDQAYNDTEDRSLSSSISAILKSGGSSNNIADMYGNSEQGRQQMSIIRENMRMKKVEAYLAEMDTMAQEEEKNWLVNDYGPYINKLKAIGEAKKAAAEQTAKGIDSLGGMGMGGGGKKSTDSIGYEEHYGQSAGREPNRDRNNIRH